MGPYLTLYEQIFGAIHMYRLLYTTSPRFQSRTRPLHLRSQYHPWTGKHLKCTGVSCTLGTLRTGTFKEPKAMHPVQVILIKAYLEKEAVIMQDAMQGWSHMPVSAFSASLDPQRSKVWHCTCHGPWVSHW